MSTSSKKRTAERLFTAAFSLFEECRYEPALIELRRAEDAFRKLDAQGHPFNHLLSNGVSGLANTLALSGRCYQRLGNTENAIACYETSFINSKFERTKPFSAFVADLREDLIVCYADTLENMDERTRLVAMEQDIRIDTTCRFPFSLTKDSVILARLYELAPERYPHLRDFAVRAAEQDAALRRSDKKSDESMMQKARIYVLLVFGSLWAAYCLLVVKALFLK
jgi:tetratricopeptide (TPR) repeat protein